jgi:hypothetical protein
LPFAFPRRIELLLRKEIGNVSRTDEKHRISLPRMFSDPFPRSFAIGKIDRAQILCQALRASQRVFCFSCGIGGEDGKAFRSAKNAEKLPVQRPRAGIGVGLKHRDGAPTTLEAVRGGKG